MSDETLDPAASVEEQPASEAVPVSTDVSTPESTPAVEASAAPEGTEQPSTNRMWAGKYQSPDELERAYLESQREASRMAGELSAFKRTGSATTPTTSEPKWKQLEQERNKWAQYLRNPNLSEDQKWQADEQVRLHDREIAYERARHEMTQETQRLSATKKMESQVSQVLAQYQTDLHNMNSPLYQAAAAQYQDLLQAGYPDTDTTKALAVTYAAAYTKTNVSKAVQQDRGALLKTLNTQVKKAVVAGAGGPSTMKSGGVSATDIEKMSEREFAEYERKLLGV